MLLNFFWYGNATEDVGCGWREDESRVTAKNWDAKYCEVRAVECGVNIHVICGWSESTSVILPAVRVAGDWA